VYESGRARLFRRRLADGTTLLCQRTLGPDAAKRRAHELSMLEHLQGVRGTPQLSQQWTAADLIVFDEAGPCLPLSVVRADRTDWPALVRLAEELTRILGLIHRRGVVHGSLHPENIFVAGAAAAPLLFFFDLAFSGSEERPPFMQHGAISSEVAYLAPEQSGRTSRVVDPRADLYALGATLYYLASARPPFTSGDPLQLLYDLLTHAPEPLTQLEPETPRALAEIVARLLEKEPDRRYQSADGLAHDLARLADALARGQDAAFPLGERDFPLRLAPPARLIGRELELRTLRKAFDDALHGSSRGVLVAGAPGVGKTALVSELKSQVTQRGGWFVSGKFDHHRQDLASDAVNQVFRALGRLLLAEPESVLVALRERMLALLGPNANLVTSLLPEFALLLNTQPEPGSSDPLKTEGRLIQASVDMLRTIATPERPIVLVLDDLQWSASTPLNFLDAVLLDDALRGLMVVGAYRGADVDAAHPLAARLSRWQRLGAAPVMLQLKNLPPAAIHTLLDEMLRLGPQQAAALAEAVVRHTAGNPYDTVELINALRRDGVLVPSERGWSWDAAAIRGYLGRGDVIGLLAARIERLPTDAEALVSIMACLGGELTLEVLAAASGFAAETLEERLAPALEDGLLVVMRTASGSAVCFRHDRVQQAAYGRLSPSARHDLHLSLARRLAAAPERAALAAEQYLPAIAAIAEPDEQRRVAELLRDAARAARAINFPRAERFLSAALSLLGERHTPADLALFAELQIAHHAALYSLAHLEEADQAYAAIARHVSDPLALTEAACVQISSLCNRGRHSEALALGFDLLLRLGFAAPSADVSGEVERGMARLLEWFCVEDHAADMGRAEITDPAIRAAAQLINRLMAPAFFQDPMAAFWMVLQAERLWSEHGPCAALVGPLGYAGFVTIALRQDYHTCHAAVRRVLAVSEAYGYEPESAHARFLYSVSILHWSEPLEDSLPHARRAHEGLLRAGDLQNACFTYWTSISALLECASLESTSEEVDAALAFTTRTANEQVAQSYIPYRQLVRALRGRTREPGSFSDGDFDEQLQAESLAPNTAVTFQIVRALSAALFGQRAELIRHAGAAMSLLDYVPAAYSTAIAYLLHALAWAERLRAAAPEERPPLRAELERCRGWLALRAIEAPTNFLHLLKFVDAERAWALGDPWGAAAAFDTALREVEPHARPWHRAFIAERAALFHLAHGLTHAARRLLLQARRYYLAWGATAKVEQLQRTHDLPRLSGARGHALG
jgi:predicted ATPase